MTTRTYEDVANRVIAAVEEFNAAMIEAYNRDDMNVFIKETHGVPMQLGYLVAQPTHKMMAWKATLHGKQSHSFKAV